MTPPRIRIHYTLRELVAGDGADAGAIRESLTHRSVTVPLAAPSESAVRRLVLGLADGREVAHFTWQRVSDGGKV